MQHKLSSTPTHSHTDTHTVSVTVIQGKSNYLISWTVARWTGSTRSILEISTDAVFGIESGVWYMPAVCYTPQIEITQWCNMFRHNLKSDSIGSMTEYMKQTTTASDMTSHSITRCIKFMGKKM